MARPGFVYILASKPNGTLYVGVTSDPARRISEHRSGAASRFTTEYGADRLVYVERYDSIQDAIEREKRLKKWNRAWKLRIIREQNPTWRDLWADLESQPGSRGSSWEGRMGPRLRGDDSSGKGGKVKGGSERQGGAVVPPRPSAPSDGRGGAVGRAAALLALLLTFAACGDEPAETRLAGEGPAVLAALAVEVEAPAEGDSLAEARATFQADEAGSVWYDALAAPGDDAAMGYTVDGRPVLDGWRWWTDADSTTLGPRERVRGVARPDVALRSYLARDTSGFLVKLFDQIRGRRPARLSERVTLLDGGAGRPGALLVEVPDEMGVVAFRPVRGDRGAAGLYRVEQAGDALAFAPADLAADSAATGPVWTAAVAAGGAVRSVSVAADVPEGGRDAAFRLGEIAFETPGAVAVSTGPTAAAAVAEARRALANAGALRERRSRRLAAVVDDIGFETEDEATNMAFRWAALSLDALARRDSGRVYLAPGLPGAEPASYPSAAWTVGAFLDLGQWDTARDLVTTLGAAQRFDRRIDLLGRAPDLVPYDGDPVFASADGTPLFLGAAGDYVRTTGDRSIVTGGSDFWFKTVFALRGIYEPDTRNGSATDDQGFLVSRGPRGTFLDGDPERGGAVRRGATAEGQGALYQALETATQFARIMGVSQRSSASWYADTSDVLLDQFQRRFVRAGDVADRVDGGRPAPGERPGGLLALALLDGLPTEERGALAQRLAERLVFPYGVASLAQTDTLFHPYLDAPDYYPAEAARTGGAVWTWLAGPVATLFAETGGAGAAAELMRNQTVLLLDRDVIGAIPELVAGHPRTAETPPAVGGAPVNPWSLASYVRGTVEGLVGARYQSADTLVVAPSLPEFWGETTVRMRLGGGAVRLTLAGTATGLDARVEPEGDLPAGAAIVFEESGRRVVVPLGRSQGDTLTVARDPFDVAVTPEGATLDGELTDSAPLADRAADWSAFAFATPDLRDEYPVMRAVESRRDLGPDQILRDNPRARVVLSQTDPDGDDWGATSTFVYPEGVARGALDATYLEVARDDSTTYVRAEFAALPRDPQTIVAFAIDTEDGGQTTVGNGADYAFPEDQGYEYVVFVGDGLVVEDAAGRRVGELAGQSVFEPATGSLRFALPSFVVPPLGRGATVTMLVGALEPGEGAGRFRRVAEEVSATTGGGRVDRRAPNVYDVVVGRVR
ncbi:amylo-alpha-1,6-glucosidase [Rubrivirga sp. S365]|uniref:GIY-YIG nuclease family protein n=1 Tax=Rubrivirga sp. S365 TaxID=3076080 RepID=UPI0028C75CDA|nr:GIY-YIG nuclease family protein [Rubrivirga sp. S365]MDT7856294.1 amylo-alpha-1,6-glucosidase [Rubrivirga sp. S365]